MSQLVNLSAFALKPAQLRRYTDAATLPASTQKAGEFAPEFAQRRAFKAIATALDIQASGYHIFAVGENGLGKRTLITRLLKARAQHEATPDDLLYVHNFMEPRRPIALLLPAGTGVSFARDIDKLWQSCHKKLLQKFTSLSYQHQLGALKQALSIDENALIAAFNDIAKTHNLRLNVHPSTLAFDSTPKEIFSVIDPNKAINERALPSLQKKLTTLNHALDELEDKHNQAIDALHDGLAAKALTPLFAQLTKKYSQPEIQTYLSHYFDDIVAHALRVIDDADDEFRPNSFSNTPARYSATVLVSHAPDSGAPIVFEELPTHLNLLGHIEYLTQMGTVYCDVSMIRAGALHKANGGYLLLEAQSLLEHPYAWQGLKRALQSKKIKISSLEQMLTLTGSLSLAPEGVDLNVKVILLGEPDLYYELLEFEPEFNAVFKVRADFHETTARTPDSELAIAYKIADMVKSNQLMPFDCHACAAIIDELSCLADDNAKLALHSDRLAQLLLESHRAATLDPKHPKLVTRHHVISALSDIRERKSHLQELYWQEIQTGQQLISTQGTAVGQINALTVISYADSEFGMPARLTALIAPKFGHGDILDIERDVELGGSLHAKGMLIMTSFLRALFSEFSELNFSASLAFEQSYDYIDGDSATLAEACALLSALANVPIAQNLAITGSMNQLGQAQAVGGVNAKVAGFFDACSEQGLTGTQGVILPRANLGQLMLRDDIVAAVAEGKFHIYAIDNVYDALAILTGIGIRDKNKSGGYKKNSLFGKIIARLASWDDKDDKDDRSAKK